MRFIYDIRRIYLVALALLPLLVDFWAAQPYEPIKIRVFFIVTNLVMVALVVRFASQKELPTFANIRSSVTALDLWVAGFFTTLAVSTFFSVEPLTSFSGSFDRGTGLLYWWHCLVAYAILRSGARAAHLQVFIRTTAVAALVASVYAFAQRAGWDLPGLVGTFKLYGLSGPTRAFATLGHPNFLGAWFAMALPLLIMSTQRDNSRFWRHLSLIASALAAATVVLTYSRGAWIAAVAAMAIYLVVHRPRTIRWYSTAIIASSAFVLGIAMLLVTHGQSLEKSSNSFTSRAGTLLDFSRGSNLARLNEWSGAVNLMKQRPWFGYGLETYMQYAAGRVKSPLERNRDFSEADPSVADRLHNLFLDTFWAGGFFALLALAGLIAAAALEILRQLLRPTRRARARTAAIAAALSAYLISNLVSFDFSISGIWLFVLLALLQSWE